MKVLCSQLYGDDIFRKLLPMDKILSQLKLRNAKKKLSYNSVQKTLKNRNIKLSS